MKRHKRAGFTIVETLIVLAVSGVLFISVAALISGQINRYRTRDAVFNLESSVRDVLNDVSTGYYPENNYNNIDCDDHITGGSGRGKNTCVLAGKKIVFTQTGIVATPVVASGSLTTTPSITSQLKPLDNLSETKNYQWGITPTIVGKTFYVINKNYGTSNSSGVSGGQAVGLYGVQPDGTTLVALPSVSVSNVVCFVNGGQKSSITLGKDGGLTVNAEIKSSCT